MSKLTTPLCAMLLACSAASAQDCDCNRGAIPYATGFSSVPMIAPSSIASVPMTAAHCVTVPIQCVTVVPRYEDRTVERTVMVPKLVNEKRKVKEIEYQRVQREREVTVYERRPRERTVKQRREICEPVERTRSEDYTVLKPVTENVRRRYTVQVPQRVRRTGYRTVMRPEYVNQTQDYTVMVPQRVRRTATRVEQRMVPVTRRQTVMQDAGYWRSEQVAINQPVTAMVAATTVGAASGYGCNPCVPVSCGCQTEYMTRQVYVPRTVAREQHCTGYERQAVRVPYSYDEVTYRPEKRRRTVRVERMRQVREPYEYTEIAYRTEQRVRTEQVQRMVEQRRRRTIRYTEMVPRTKVENVRVTEYEDVPVKRRETYTALVPREVEREVTVQVYKETPRRITERVRVPVETVIR